ncbi:hypothetical protein PV396_24655 [Streptomyces sp. ME02-8801-2C]|uniref:hypothetical protein n=1 Tax=Streptomyces sp. ME02-8801-2C TaxID=3028680 RepID=UPI0029BA4105|nr:hypothetical protein [Streptomyces sp. ME02-8801-2C]MDX3455094.1 hypothetical protein [Streptomyces sp. ME02-8801-2C]
MIERDTKVTISIDLDLNALSRVSDSRLAMVWHVAQANPAPHADEMAGRVVAKVGWEIIRRWLAATPPEMYHHQQDHYRGKHLSRFAIYRDGDWHPDPTKLAKYETEQAQKAADETAPASEEYQYCGADLARRSEYPLTCHRRIAHKGPCSPLRDQDGGA